MKKLFGFIATAMLLVLPIKANAEVTYGAKSGEPDANGIVTVDILATISAGSTYNGFDGTIKATNAFIESIGGSDEFIYNETSSSIEPDKTSAHLVTAPTGLSYTGTGAQVKVGEIKYRKDPNATEDCNITFTPRGATEVKVTPKKTENPKTGSALPYVGIIAGVALIAGAYIISKRSTKLYRM
jgi:LPXTG-motif cell wall-anchored protein